MSGALPGATSTTVSTLWSGRPDLEIRQAPDAVLISTCPAERALTIGYDASGVTNECRLLSGREGAAVIPLEEITRRLSLTAADANRVGTGALVLSDPSLADVERLTLLLATPPDPQASRTGLTAVRSATLPVVHVPAARLRDGSLPAGFAAVLADSAVADLGFRTRPEALLVRDPQGQIPAEAEAAVAERLPVPMVVERGAHDPRFDRLMMIFYAVTGLLLVIVTLIATALTVTEQRADAATLAAVGATPWTRRAWAAAQAGLIGAVGAVLGVAVGLAPGVALAHELTVGSFGPPGNGGAVIQVPWLPLLGVALAVSALAALLAGVAVRRLPPLTRRLD